MNTSQTRKFQFYLSLSLMVICALHSLWAAGFATDDSVPAGFESLAGPRPMFVDIIFSDQLVGTVRVVIEGDKLSFDDPDQIMAMLNMVEPSDALYIALASPQSTHVDRLCFRPGDPAGCGSVEPNPFALLFDEDALKVTIFVDRALQKVRTDNVARFLKTPQRRGSAILAVDASANSFSGEAWEYNIRGESWFGYGEGYLRGVFGLDSRQGDAQLNSLALVHQLQDHELLAGSFAFPAGPTLSSFNTLGLRISSSTQTRLNPDSARGSELSVLLDRRSLVKLFVDGRLYSTQSLDAGHVAVDTTDLPDGNQEVEVRIADPVSGERTEYHRFTRSTLLPPHNETAMEFAAGAPLRRDDNKRLPLFHNVGVASLRLARRTTADTAVALGFTRLGKLYLLQPELVWLHRHLSLKTSASLGIRGELGLGLQGIWHSGSFAATLSGEWFNYGGKFSLASQSVINRKSWLPNETAQLRASLDNAFNRTSVGLFGSVRNESVGKSTKYTTSVGFRLRHRLFERRRLRSSFTAGLRLERGIVNASVDLRVSFTGRTRATSLLLGVAGSRSSPITTRALVDEKPDTTVGYETRWRVAQEREWQYEGGFWANEGNSSTTLGLDALIGHRTFNAAIQSQWRKQDTITSKIDSYRDTAIHLSTQLVFDDSGLAFAGTETVRSGFIIDVSGEPTDAVYDIIVNSANVGSGRVGTPGFVSLPPFARYEIQLQPHSLLASSFERESFDVTVFPGNIVRLSTVARQRRLLIATLIDVDGDVLSNAALHRDEGPLLIGTNGLLQIETSNGETFKVRQSDGSLCEMSVPMELGEEEVVVMDAPLVCE
ncbi:MAG: TcfC E-set like domain-containing protein [Granulosicoccus sp.]